MPGRGERLLRDPVGRCFGENRATTNQRVILGSWPIGALSNALEEIVAQLGQPVVRIFTNDFVISAEWVKGQRNRWRM
jgi:hypothetical protein